MSDILDRAKAVRDKVAAETMVTIKLDLLVGLIARIEDYAAELANTRLTSGNQIVGGVPPWPAPQGVAKLVTKLEPGK